jgi:hypothetical protein
LQPLQTITEDYLNLNRELHESGKEYGVFGWRHAQDILDLRTDYECDTVLDYGCGKGTLGTALGSPEWMREFDPAIPGKDAKPEMADLVVCTDVLEHIEPELLDNVLFELARLTRKAALLVIATRESQKKLADGSSPHKIIEEPHWWQAKLATKFLVLDFKTDVIQNEVTALVTPIRPIGEIRAKSAVSDTIRYENATRNCAIVKERVLGGDLLDRHDGRICVVGFGPSLHQTWPYLLTERRAFGAKIVSVSGAHDFLISKGIVPDYHSEVDPRIHKCFFTRTPHADITYWIASCCHPELIDNLIRHKSKLALWHLLNSDIDVKIGAPDGPDPGCLLVAGGSGVGARTVNLFFTQGYRTFSLYGMDCSFANDGAQHAAEHSGKIKPEWQVKVGERWFRSSSQMVYMAKAMVEQLRMLNKTSHDMGEPAVAGSTDHCEFFFHGDGLLQNMVLEGNRLGVADGNSPGGVAPAPDQPAQAAQAHPHHLRGAA